VPPISDRPRGTVTFLFTDIEGSTRLWEGGRSAMSEALERHDKILQKAISDSGGVIFSTGGDGLAAAFQRAPDALRAALDAQARLQSQTWDPPLSVRMAIHTGDVEERAGDFFGPPLNRCARLMASPKTPPFATSAHTASGTCHSRRTSFRCCIRTSDQTFLRFVHWIATGGTCPSSQPFS
jgi:class 3 adenylate cyclase